MKPRLSAVSIQQASIWGTDATVAAAYGSSWASGNVARHAHSAVAAAKTTERIVPVRMDASGKTRA